MSVVFGIVWLAASVRWSGWALAVAGIPILGLLTYDFGPIWGLLALAIGAAILSAPVMRRRVLQ